MPRKPRILVVNDYSLNDSWLDARERRSPFHFLYGVDHLQSNGFEVEMVTEDWSRWLAAIDRHVDSHLHTAFGSIDRQVAASAYLNRVAAIYSPCQTQIQTLTYLRALGIIRVPIVQLAHHPLVRGRFGRLIRPLVRGMLRGLAALPCLARAVADEANALAGGGRSVATALPWGPDAVFYPSAEYPGERIIAAGRTGRDFLTFGRAAALERTPATIVTFRDSVTPQLEALGPSVHLVVPDVFIPYSETSRMFARARALAIPLLGQDGLCGLTSLMDALGAGKPVIMTRSKFIDLDIEREGIGRWVDPGDVEGWQRALRYFHDNPGVATEMGRRGRALVDAGLSYREFSDNVVRIVNSAIAESE
jgi:glycosyltransferase involved in cell wall biosynthesis